MRFSDPNRAVDAPGTLSVSPVACKQGTTCLACKLCQFTRRRWHAMDAGVKGCGGYSMHFKCKYSADG